MKKNKNYKLVSIKRTPYDGEIPKTFKGISILHNALTDRELYIQNNFSLFSCMNKRTLRNKRRKISRKIVQLEKVIGKNSSYLETRKYSSSFRYTDPILREFIMSSTNMSVAHGAATELAIRKKDFLERARDRLSSKTLEQRQKMIDILNGL